jgi:hypothetical protein
MECSECTMNRIECTHTKVAGDITMRQGSRSVQAYYGIQEWQGSADGGAEHADLIGTGSTA